MANGRDGKRHILGRITDNWISRSYLMLWAALLAWSVWDSTLVQHQDSSFAVVWLWLVTAPTSLALTFLPEGEGAAGLLLHIAPTLGAALLNAFLIGAAVRRVRRGSPVRA
ncbi:hypothetical protein ABTZ58_24050 [Streptomyces sp. NPDC094143]|uniref:SCO4225 family membrane protein n=1 Tax=Streptomyces sp. NPDC094143 TaxID=3155310 RepID=UPI0033292884